MKLIKTIEERSYDDLSHKQKLELEWDFHDLFYYCGKNKEVMNQLDEEIGFKESSKLIVQIVNDLMFNQVELN